MSVTWTPSHTTASWYRVYSETCCNGLIEIGNSDRAQAITLYASSGNYATPPALTMLDNGYTFDTQYLVVNKVSLSYGGEYDSFCYLDVYIIPHGNPCAVTVKFKGQGFRGNGISGNPTATTTGPTATGFVQIDLTGNDTLARANPPTPMGMWSTGLVGAQGLLLPDSAGGHCLYQSVNGVLTKTQTYSF